MTVAGYAAVDAALLARKPVSLSMREAAALPLAVITAWEGLVDRARVRRKAAALADAGALRPLADARRFTRRTVADAHQAVEDGTAASKIVVDISE